MAKKNEGPSDMATGKRSTDCPQMKALKTAQGTPVRQSTLPPFISKNSLPGETD